MKKLCIKIGITLALSFGIFAISVSSIGGARAACAGNGTGGIVCCDEISGNCLWGDSSGTYHYDNPVVYYPV